MRPRNQPAAVSSPTEEEREQQGKEGMPDYHQERFVWQEGDVEFLSQEEVDEIMKREPPSGPAAGRS